MNAVKLNITQYPSHETVNESRDRLPVCVDVVTVTEERLSVVINSGKTDPGTEIYWRIFGTSKEPHPRDTMNKSL